MMAQFFVVEQAIVAQFAVVACTRVTVYVVAQVLCSGTVRYGGTDSSDTVCYGGSGSITQFYSGTFCYGGTDESGTVYYAYWHRL